MIRAYVMLVAVALVDVVHRHIGLVAIAASVVAPAWIAGPAMDSCFAQGVDRPLERCTPDSDSGTSPSGTSVLGSSVLGSSDAAESASATPGRLKEVAVDRLTAEQLFDTSRLIDIRIKLAEADWEVIRHQRRSMTEALGPKLAASPFTYVKGNITIDGHLIENVGIRKKGFLGSLNEERPSLKIKFSEYVDQAPVDGLDRLTLNNNNQDASRLSQYLSYKVFNDSGTIAPRCNLAKVTVNGDYLGIYSNVESVKRPFLKRFGDDSGALYEGTVTDFFADSIERFEPKNDRAKIDDLHSIVTLLDKTPLDVSALEKELDVDAFLRFWATESLIGFWDGYTHGQNNFFVYRNPANAKLYWIPWGTDSAFVASMPLPPYIIPNKSVHSQSVLANRLYANPETRRRYHDAVRDLLANHWNDQALLADIDRVRALIEPHVLSSNRKFKRSVRSVRYFVSKRREVFEDEMQRWPIHLKSGPKKPPVFDRIGSAEVTFAGKWYDKKPSDPIECGQVDAITLVIDGEPVQFKKIGVYAAPDENKRDAEGNAPPTIVFVGTREPEDTMVIVAVGVSQDDFHTTGDKDVAVGGLFIQGNPVWYFTKMAFGKAEMIWIRGTASLTEAAMQPNAPIAGKLQLVFFKMIGGKPID